jgi:ABC-type multidrug transport system permease subunit
VRRIFDLTVKDLIELMRDRMTFMFLLIMPILFTLLFGFASGAFSRGVNDPRLPVGFLDQDDTWLSHSLRDQLSASKVIGLRSGLWRNQSDLEAMVTDEKLSGAIIVPAGYSRAVLRGENARLVLIGDVETTVGRSIEGEAVTAVIHILNAVNTALVMEQAAGDRTPFDFTFSKALSAWENPPIQIKETTSSAIPANDDKANSLAQTSPGMMLQFSIAGLMTAAHVIVNERKSGALRRLLTTSTARWQILLGHYLAIFVLIFDQFLTLILFGQLFLGVNYLRAPAATLLVSFCGAMGISALGLLIGVQAKNQEQAVIFSMVLMFLLSGSGGTMVPLEVTSQTFQTIGHLSPVAWAMDGFKDVILRGYGIETVWRPSLALLGYAVLFLALAAIRFSRLEQTL